VASTPHTVSLAPRKKAGADRREAQTIVIVPDAIVVHGENMALTFIHFKLLIENPSNQFGARIFPESHFRSCRLCLVLEGGASTGS